MKTNKDETETEAVFTSIDIEESEAAIEEATGDEQDKQEDNIVYVQEPIAKDKKKRRSKPKTSKPKIKKDKSIKYEPENAEYPDAVHPNH